MIFIPYILISSTGQSNPANMTSAGAIAPCARHPNPGGGPANCSNLSNAVCKINCCRMEQSNPPTVGLEAVPSAMLSLSESGDKPNISSSALRDDAGRLFQYFVGKSDMYKGSSFLPTTARLSADMVAVFCLDARNLLLNPRLKLLLLLMMSFVVWSGSRLSVDR